MTSTAIEAGSRAARQERRPGEGAAVRTAMVMAAMAVLTLVILVAGCAWIGQAPIVDLRL